MSKPTYSVVCDDNGTYELTSLVGDEVTTLATGESEEWFVRNLSADILRAFAAKIVNGRGYTVSGEPTVSDGVYIDNDGASRSVRTFTWRT